MASRNTVRWPLGLTALAAMAIAGCGTAVDNQGHRLHAAAEKRLLTLVAHARTDLAHRQGAAAHTALTDFVSDVGSLRSSGELTAATAGSLDRQARLTDAQIGLLLRTSVNANGTPTGTPAQTSDATATHGSRPATAPTPPALKPVKHDQGPKVHMPGPPGHGGGDSPGHDKHRFPRGPSDGPAGNGDGAGGD